MQLAILSLGVLVFVFYLFTPPPLFFNPRRDHAAREWAVARPTTTRSSTVHRGRGRRARAATCSASSEARWRARPRRPRPRIDALEEDRRRFTELRNETAELIAPRPARRPDQRHELHLPHVRAAPPAGGPHRPGVRRDLRGIHELGVVRAERADVDHGGRRRAAVGDRASARDGPRAWLSRASPSLWAAFAVGFAEYASRLGSLDRGGEHPGLAVLRHDPRHLPDRVHAPARRRHRRVHRRAGGRGGRHRVLQAHAGSRSSGTTSSALSSR